MKSSIKIWLFIGMGSIILSSCYTGSCPNCVNPKPEYYNSAKAKEARRMMRHNHNKSVTGGLLEIDQDQIKKKEKKSSQQADKKQKPIL